MNNEALYLHNYIIKEIDNIADINYLNKYKDKIDFFKNLKVEDIDYDILLFPYKYNMHGKKIFDINFDGNYVKYHNYKVYNTVDNLYNVSNNLYQELHKDSPHRYPVELLKKYKSGTIVDCGSSNCTLAILIAEAGIYMSKFHFVLIDSEEKYNEDTIKIMNQFNCTYEIINTFIDSENKLDDIIKQDDVICIKSDLEGYDYDALISAENIIQKCNPVLMFCSYHKDEHYYMMYNYLYDKYKYVYNSDSMIWIYDNYINFPFFRNVLCIAHN